jgi:hypothetical protein
MLLNQANAGTTLHTPHNDFICGGKVESKVWQLWDNSAKEYLSMHQFSKRLLEQGDT